MKIFLAILLALMTAIAASGCAEQSTFNQPDQQRDHAEKAQGEMSSDMTK